MRRVAVVFCGLAVLAGLFWQFPLFHVVRLDGTRAEKQESRFNAAGFAAAFCSERLLPALDEAADAGAVLAAIRDNPQAAGRQFGRKVGLGRTRFFVVRGAGTIVSADKKGILVSLEQNESGPQVLLHTGLLFGNTARDASGLLDAGDFPHSEDFNEISTELNRIIEKRVLPQLREKAEVGRRVQFVGCAQVPDEGASRTLMIIPLKATVE
jgi:predicted lipoprotein